MYKITNLKFRVCIVIHETRYTKHEDFVYRLVNSMLDCQKRDIELFVILAIAVLCVPNGKHSK